MRIPCTEWLSNTESQRAGAELRNPHREVQTTKERDINAQCIKYVQQFIEPFLLTVLNVSYCPCEEPFIVLSTTVLWSNRHLVESNTI